MVSATTGKGGFVFLMPFVCMYTTYSPHNVSGTDHAVLVSEIVVINKNNTISERTFSNSIR